MKLHFCSGFQLILKIVRLYVSDIGINKQVGFFFHQMGSMTNIMHKFFACGSTIG